MVGSALKKMAAENGMKVAKGVAYGSFRGYCTTLSEGAGYKQMVLATTFPEQSKQDELIGLVSRADVSKEYRVQSLDFAPNGINIVFLDNPGTMKKINAFIEWFFPLLEQYGASHIEICPECGMPVENGRWILRDGVAAFYVHESCGEKISRQIEEEKEEKKKPGNGSYGTGLLGSLLGALLGAIVWGIVLYMGYVASVVGLLIGWLANKGYDLLKGKQGKGKIIILIVAIVFGVLLGTILPDVVYLAQGIGSGEYIITYGEIFPVILATLLYEPEYQQSVLANGGLGLLFAALGVFALLRKASKEVADAKILYLE